MQPPLTLILAAIAACICLGDSVLAMFRGAPVVSNSVQASTDTPQGMILGTKGTDNGRPLAPYFDLNTPLNVSAHIGKSAFLTCIVHNVGNLTVSWVRHRDIHILTVGAYTYTSDQRFMSLHQRDSNEWTLQIKWVQKRDAGMYECQVSSIPVQSHFVQLFVVVPSAVIHGTSEVHIEHGSTINLTCSINYGTEPPAYIFWYHHDKSGKVAVVNYDSDRGGISVITVKAEVSTSHLVIRGASEADAGKYYCSPSNADVAFVHVHVHSSKSPSAIQTSTGTLGNGYVLMTMLMVWLAMSV